MITASFFMQLPSIPPPDSTTSFTPYLIYMVATLVIAWPGLLKAFKALLDRVSGLLQSRQEEKVTQTSAFKDLNEQVKTLFDEREKREAQHAADRDRWEKEQTDALAARDTAFTAERSRWMEVIATSKESADNAIGLADNIRAQYVVDRAQDKEVFDGLMQRFAEMTEVDKQKDTDLAAKIEENGKLKAELQTTQERLEEAERENDRLASALRRAEERLAQYDAGEHPIISVKPIDISPFKEE